MPIEGMMSSDKYIDVIENKAIPDMRKAFPYGGGILRQDLAPCHSSTKVKAIFRKNKLSLNGLKTHQTLTPLRIRGQYRNLSYKNWIAQP